MESLYYVLCWACHRKCRHCYDERFRPYAPKQLEAVVREAQTNFPRIVDNLPERMRFLQPATLTSEACQEKIGRIVLAGGETLLDPVRTRVLYPVLQRLREKYGADGIKTVVQTTGDLLTARIVEELLARGVWMISVAGMDDHHVGLEGDKRKPLAENLTRIFEKTGMKPSGWQGALATTRNWSDEQGPVYHFFGATPEEWIGKLWPRGRAWSNGLSKAGMDDNFCKAWSGARNFLDHRHAGSEVAIDPNGDVYPCCMKTKLPIGNLIEERLLDILDSLAGHPVYAALTQGHPERMGIAYGWSTEMFLQKSAILTPRQQPYRNLCIGCDRFHDEVLRPVIGQLRELRRRHRVEGASTPLVPAP